MLVLGLMSGTSADGIDAALVSFSGDPNRPKWKIINSSYLPYPQNLKNNILDISQGRQFTAQEFLDLSEKITNCNIQAALSCDPSQEANLVGCHGQTVAHRATSKGTRGASLQIIQAPFLAQALGVPVVTDFRSFDIALGGQGAPLVPVTDKALFGINDGWQAFLNLGGIANLTLIPPKKAIYRSFDVIGWDCGPANSLIDLAIIKFTKGKYSYDPNGLYASKGSPDNKIIDRWLNEPYFLLNPPKSTGREQFGRADLERRLQDMTHLSQSDQLSTLTSFTAQIVAQDLEKVYSRNLIRPVELVLAGGGCRNSVLRAEINRRCRGMRFATIDEKGIPAESKEALSFALLAWWHCLKIPGNAPSVTGAKKSVVLGTLDLPR